MGFLAIALLLAKVVECLAICICLSILMSYKQVIKNTHDGKGSCERLKVGRARKRAQSAHPAWQMPAPGAQVCQVLL